MVHDFYKSLEKSHMAEDLPFWEQVYRGAWSDFSAMVNHRQDGEHQRAGIDRSVILTNSKQILIDEKVRYPAKSGHIYTDILLEVISNDVYNTPGWVKKNLRADFIAYAIVGIGVCYLLPVPFLQKAWIVNGSAWEKKYGRKYAPNQGYNTVNVGVPVEVLFPAIGKCLRVPFAAEQPSEYILGVSSCLAESSETGLIQQPSTKFPLKPKFSLSG